MSQNAPIYPLGVCDLKVLGDQSRYPLHSMGGGYASVIICTLDGENFGRYCPHDKIIPAYYVLCGKLRSTEHSTQVTVPLPRRHHRIRSFRSGCVRFASSHASILCVNCANAVARPTSGHCAMCLHISLQLLQLGHRGLLPSWCERNIIVPATPRTCFAAHNWHNPGSLCSGQWIDFWSTALNCSNDRSLWLQ
jgi:hypothetical protein